MRRSSSVFLHAFEHHRILERHQTVEASLLERIFAEESEHPSGTDSLSARRLDVLPHESARLGDRGAHASDEMPFRLRRQSRRDEEVADRPHWATDVSVDACLLGRPLTDEDRVSGIRYASWSNAVTSLRSVLLGIGRDAGREIKIRDGH